MILYELGRVQYAARQYKGARGSFESCVHLKSDFVNGHFRLGKTYGKLGEYDRSLKSFNKAVSLKPDFDLAYYEIGNIYKTKKEIFKSSAGIF